MEKTILELFENRVRKTPDLNALCYKETGEWKTITWQGYKNRVDRFAKALIAQGIGTGDKVALIGSNIPEWFIADMAIMTMGAVTVPIYATSSGEQICYVLNHAECKLFIVEETGYFQRIEKFLDDVPKLERVIVVKGSVPPNENILMDLSTFEMVGEKVSEEDLKKVRAQITPNSVGFFIYTSGTTGPPKAVMLTHKNSVTAARNVFLTMQTETQEKVCCTYLPLSHIAERCVNLFSNLLLGTTVYFMRGYEHFAEDLKEIRPTLWAGVPRVWEKLYEGVMKYRDSLPEKKQKIIDWALRTGSEFNWRKYEGKNIPFGLKAKYHAARLLVLKKLLAALGFDRVEATVTGGAPTSEEILDFFVSIGIWLQDVYGQTEGHGTTSFATKDAIRFGSAGKPYPLVEVRIADDDEILVKGDNVSPGYYKDPELTKETFKDGWLYSGDLGYLDEDGFLWITGRKKDIIITSGGKNITPSKIETALMGLPLIEHAVVVGDGKKYLTALLTVSEEEGRKFAQKEGKAVKDRKDLLALKAVNEEIERHVNKVNEKLSRVEQVKKYRILPGPFSVETGELTHILKIKRNVVRDKFAKEIEELYSKNQWHSNPLKIK
jgi:long-chain acyl-CoA synthetase